MRAAIRWTVPALADLGELRDYVARDDPGAARRLAAAIRKRVEALAEHPRLGRVVPELPGRDLREVVVPPCRIVYRCAGGAADATIVILRVWHGRRHLVGSR